MRPAALGKTLSHCTAPWNVRAHFMSTSRRSFASRVAETVAMAESWSLCREANTSALPRDAQYPEAARRTVDAEAMREARARLERWPEYAVTPLHNHPELARALDVRSVLLKDETSRMGELNSFKALGGALAAEDAVRASASNKVTVTTASAGNHGLAVAWGATRSGAASRGGSGKVAAVVFGRNQS